MYDELGEDLPHKLVVSFHKLLFLDVLASALGNALVLLLAHQALENALHVLVVSRNGEFVERD